MSDSAGIASDYRSALAAEVREIERRLGGGGAKSFEEYLARCAEIKAIKRALAVFESTLERYLKAEEFDDLDEVLE